LNSFRIEQQEAGMIPFGTEYRNPNFVTVAGAMGAKGIRLENPGDVERGLREALAHRDGPIVVDAVVDPNGLAIPFHVPLHTAVGFTLSAWKQVASGHPGLVIDEIKHNLGLAKETGLLS